MTGISLTYKPTNKTSPWPYDGDDGTAVTSMVTNWLYDVGAAALAPAPMNATVVSSSEHAEDATNVTIHCA